MKKKITCEKKKNTWQANESCENESCGQKNHMKIKNNTFPKCEKCLKTVCETCDYSYGKVM